MRTLYLLLRGYLSLLCVLLGVSPLASAAAWAYDGRAQLTTPYDGTSAQVVSYDSVAVPAGVGEINPTARESCLFGNSADFLAEERGLAGSIRNVNPTGGGWNCVNCAIAGDATLAGNAASALPGGATSIRVLETTFGGTFQPVSGQMQIGSILSQSGNGSRGIAFGQSLIANRSGHVFNAVNQVEQSASWMLRPAVSASTTSIISRTFNFCSPARKVINLITKTEALKIVSKKPKEMIPSDDTFVCDDTGTIEKPFGWVFFYNSKTYLEPVRFVMRLPGTAQSW